MVKPPSPSQYMRKAIKKEYTIYGILYDGSMGERVTATVAAGSDTEALSMLEKSLIEDKGYEKMKGDLNPEITDTGFKTSRQGLIFGFDTLSNSFLK
jgi:hypothetical protein